MQSSQPPDCVLIVFGSSLILSRELYGSGSWPNLSTAELHKVHSNVCSFFRNATGEIFMAADVDLISDSTLLHTYSLRPPEAVVRFARLRLSVRIILYATLELLTLLYESRTDSRSWLKACLEDLEWMAKIGQKYTYTPAQLFALCRNSPKLARRLVREACDTSEARHISLSTIRPSVLRAIDGFVCFCGKKCATKPVLCSPPLSCT